MSNMLRAIAREGIRREFGNRGVRSLWRKLTFYADKHGHMHKIGGNWAAPVILRPPRKVLSLRDSPLEEILERLK